MPARAVGSEALRSSKDAKARSLCAERRGRAAAARPPRHPRPVAQRAIEAGTLERVLLQCRLTPAVWLLIEPHGLRYALPNSHVLILCSCAVMLAASRPSFMCTCASECHGLEGCWSCWAVLPSSFHCSKACSYRRAVVASRRSRSRLGPCFMRCACQDTCGEGEGKGRGK